MKTLLATLLIATSFTLTSVSATHAGTDPARKPSQVASFQTGMYTTAEGKLNIALDKQTVGTIDVRLINEKNKVLYDQLIGKKQMTARLRLDLSELPDGTYQVLINNGKDITTHTVTLTTKSVAMSPRLIALN